MGSTLVKGGEKGLLKKSAEVGTGGQVAAGLPKSENECHSDIIIGNA